MTAKLLCKGVAGDPLRIHGRESREARQVSPPPPPRLPTGGDPDARRVQTRYPLRLGSPRPGVAPLRPNAPLPTLSSNWHLTGVIRLSSDERRPGEDEETVDPQRRGNEVELPRLPNGKWLSPPLEHHLLARWGGTAGVVNQAATFQGTATSQHQGPSVTNSGLHIKLGLVTRTCNCV
ncbi:uncharacterized protein LOC144215265 isoform X1 [Stigmatopora nigra]